MPQTPFPCAYMSMEGTPEINSILSYIYAPHLVPAMFPACQKTVSLGPLCSILPIGKLRHKPWCATYKLSSQASHFTSLNPLTKEN